MSKPTYIDSGIGRITKTRAQENHDKWTVDLMTDEERVILAVVVADVDEWIKNARSVFGDRYHDVVRQRIADARTDKR